MRSDEVPGRTYGSRSSVSIFSTARSLLGSAPTSLAGNSRPSWRLTLMREARPTTCSLVSTWPSGSMITPEPRLCAVRGMPGSKKSRKKRSKKGSPRKTENGLRCCTSVSVSTLTTAGPTFSTTSTAAVRRRKGSPATAGGAGSASSAATAAAASPNRPSGALRTPRSRCRIVLPIVVSSVTSGSVSRDAIRRTPIRPSGRAPGLVLHARRAPSQRARRARGVAPASLRARVRAGLRASRSVPCGSRDAAC